MELKIDVERVFADRTTETLPRLARVLGAGNDEDLRHKLEKLAEAGLFELARMLGGESLPTRVADVQQNRLYYLTRFLFAGVLPSEEQVSSLFHVTETQGRTLLRNVRSRFKLDLEDVERETMRRLLDTAEKTGDGDAEPYRVVINSAVIVELINEVVAREKPFLSGAESVGHRGYRISADAMDVLRKYVG